MATRAFLLCGDEKAVQAVTQILDELEVSFEHSSEPAFSLKRLATQRFDLLIVDCDNAQNATQVFNSARASNFNKTSIAIAIVEGKAGVPNAFRLGASLVLTKPVSLDQARNTLRTGIGMTRKDTQEVKPPAPAITLPGTPAMAAAAPTVAAPAVAAPNPSAPHTGSHNHSRRDRAGPASACNSRSVDSGSASHSGGRPSRLRKRRSLRLRLRLLLRRRQL